MPTAVPLNFVIAAGNPVEALDDGVAILEVKNLTEEIFPSVRPWWS